MKKCLNEQRTKPGIAKRTAAQTKYALSAAWLAVALWMIVIFCFSAQPGEVSQLQSDSVGYYILRTVDASFSNLPPAEQAARVESVQTFIRKGAHMAEYALLGALLWNALRRTRTRKTETMPSTADQWRIPLEAILCSALYAATDELHQLFVPRRSAQFTDVCIDTAGALLGVLTCVFACEVLRRVREGTKQTILAKNQQNAEKTV